VIIGFVFIVDRFVVVLFVGKKKQRRRIRSLSLEEGRREVCLLRGEIV